MLPLGKYLEVSLAYLLLLTNILIRKGMGEGDGCWLTLAEINI